MRGRILLFVLLLAALFPAASVDVSVQSGIGVGVTVRPARKPKSVQNWNGVFHEPGADEILLVGKVSVTPKLNKDFLAKSRGLKQKDLEAPDIYTAPVYKSRYWVDPVSILHDYTMFRAGEYFCMSYPVPDDRHIELRQLYYYFYSNRRLGFPLPIAVNFDVPEGVKALYIGDFSYTVEGDDFAVTSIQTGDSLEEAQAAVDAACKNHYALQKAAWSDNRPSRVIDYSNLSGSPADSVVFYGGFNTYWNDYIFAELAPGETQPDQELDGEHFFISEPVKPGSRYILRYWDSWDGKGFKIYNWQKFFTEENSLITVEVPDKPGLYYIGCYDALKTEQNGQLTENSRHSSASMKRTALKAVLERYKGTVWEDYIRAELDKR